jgi:hypothetical protein
MEQQIQLVRAALLEKPVIFELNVAELLGIFTLAIVVLRLTYASLKFAVSALTPRRSVKSYGEWAVVTGGTDVRESSGLQSKPDMHVCTRVKIPVAGYRKSVRIRASQARAERCIDRS